MKIQDTKGFLLVAQCIKNKTKSKALIRFDYSVCEDKTILNRSSGRVYLICVNDKIYKIGYSTQKKGIKGTLGFYQGAMGGKPSIRSFGIHILISKELDKGNKVYIYVKHSESKTERIFCLNKVHIISVSPSKDFESACKKDYYDFENGKYPKWNFQEKNEQWPKDIQLAHNKQRKAQIDKRTT